MTTELGPHDWALVLAGGEGTRLHSLTKTASGVCVPKQFCSLGAGPSLLGSALARANAVASLERTCAIVAEHHRRWWQSLLLDLPPENIVAQPFSRGTGHGILMPLLQILHRDPEACLLVLPADHHVCDEATLASSMREAMAHANRSDRVILLGLKPDEADPELGYIVSDGGRVPGLRRVDQFIEKPSRAEARALIARGAVWNSFIIAAKGNALLRAFEARCPDTVAELRCVIEQSKDRAQLQRRLSSLYEQLPNLDFSRDILQKQTTQLCVLTAPTCGWSDLGTPRRVAEALTRSEPALDSWDSLPYVRGFLDLAARHAQLETAKG